MKQSIMAEIQTSANPGARCRPPLPRVDLTPMVDLGFLLIAFFMFTTTMARPNLMTVNMPIRESSTKWEAARCMVLIPTANRRVASYSGMLTGGESFVWRSVQGNNGVRSLLMEKEQSLRWSGMAPDGLNPLIVIIRPAPDCSYEDVVALLDEMQILGIRTYTLDNLQEEERAALKNSR